MITSVEMNERHSVVLEDGSEFKLNVNGLTSQGEETFSSDCGNTLCMSTEHFHSVQDFGAMLIVCTRTFCV